MTVLGIITGTPSWVWFLLIYLLASGIKALHARTVPLWLLSTRPIIFISWSLFSLYTKCNQCITMVLFWSVTTLLAAAINYSLNKTIPIKFDPQTSLVHVPGSYAPLLTAISFFSIKYALGVSYAIDPSLKGNLMVLGFDLLISGIISGSSLGRFIAFYRSTLNKNL